MHELAITESLVATVAERVGKARVARLRLQIGSLAGVVPHALRFCFEICARGTVLEGAALDIDEIPARASCRQCGAEIAMTSFLDFCGCGSADLDLLAGQELRIKHVEVRVQRQVQAQLQREVQ
jgi:hydrogenase nickel incorporation protein HypA/HybF